MARSDLNGLGRGSGKHKGYPNRPTQERRESVTLYFEAVDDDEAYLYEGWRVVDRKGFANVSYLKLQSPRNHNLTVWIRERAGHQGKDGIFHAGSENGED